MAEIVVTARSLTRTFGDFKAVDNIDFEVSKGEIFGFLGPNGAGKTTTVRILCGLLRPSSGECRVDGIDVGKNPEKVKQRIGYMSQKFSLYEDLTVGENLQFFGGIYGLRNAEIARRKKELFRLLSLGEVERQNTAELPLGWKQRVALASAVIHRPKIVFLDEPTSGVDPISRRHFWALIHNMAAEGTTVFVTTHYMEEAEYCDRISIMELGRIIALGTPGELKGRFAKSSVEEVFVHLLIK
jgi:ABC-2 type transport system ATP-binding protein